MLADDQAAGHRKLGRGERKDREWVEGEIAPGAAADGEFWGQTPSVGTCGNRADPVTSQGAESKFVPKNEIR